MGDMDVNPTSELICPNCKVGYTGKGCPRCSSSSPHPTPKPPDDEQIAQTKLQALLVEKQLKIEILEAEITRLKKEIAEKDSHKDPSKTAVISRIVAALPDAVSAILRLRKGL